MSTQHSALSTLNLLMTRRHFFGLNAAGLGTAALGVTAGQRPEGRYERTQPSHWWASRLASLCSQG